MNTESDEGQHIQTLEGAQIFFAKAVASSVESDETHGSLKAADLAKYGNIVPVESELRKKGKPPILEYYKDATSGETTHVRLKDAFFELRPKQDGDDEIAGAFVSWEQISDVTFIDEETADLLLDTMDRMNDGTPIQFDGPPATKKSMICKLGASILHYPLFRLNGQRDTSGEHIEGTWAPAVPEPIASMQELIDSTMTHKDTKELLQKIVSTGRTTLSELEYMQIAAKEGMNDIFKKGNWTKVRSMMYKAMKHGALMLYDESALMPGSIRELFNPALEWNPTFVAQGDQIRRLTRKEQEKFDKTGEVPKGVVKLSQYFRIAHADNPINTGGGRNKRTDAVASRVEVSVVGKSEEKFFKGFLEFMITGIEPNITTPSGMTYYGRENVITPYRQLKKLRPGSPIDSFEEIPNVKTYIRWWARFQMNLLQIIEDGNLGENQDEEGGNDTFTVRTFERGLEHILKLVSGARVTEESIKKGGTPVVNSNWYDAIYRTLELSYVKSFGLSDRKKLVDLIKSSRLSDLLGSGTGASNPSDPNWVAEARVNGVNVQDNGATFTISFAKLKKNNITLDQLGLSEELLNIHKDEKKKRYQVEGVWVLHNQDFSDESVKSKIIAQAQKEDYVCVAVGDDIIMVPKVVGIRDVKSYQDLLAAQKKARNEFDSGGSNSEA